MSRRSQVDPEVVAAAHAKGIEGRRLWIPPREPGLMCGNGGKTRGANGVEPKRPEDLSLEAAALLGLVRTARECEDLGRELAAFCVTRGLTAEEVIRIRGVVERMVPLAKAAMRAIRCQPAKQ